MRVYAPSRLSDANITSAKGTIFAKFNFGPFNQNLDWNAESGRTNSVQHDTPGHTESHRVTPGRRWRLQAMHLSLSGLLKNIQPNRGWDTFGDTSNFPPL